jgi:hypothetical protein
MHDAQEQPERGERQEQGGEEARGEPGARSPDPADPRMARAARPSAAIARLITSDAPRSGRAFPADRRVSSWIAAHAAPPAATRLAKEVLLAGERRTHSIDDRRDDLKSMATSSSKQSWSAAPRVSGTEDHNR